MGRVQKRFTENFGWKNRVRRHLRYYHSLDPRIFITVAFITDDYHLGASWAIGSSWAIWCLLEHSTDCWGHFIHPCWENYERWEITGHFTVGDILYTPAERFLGDKSELVLNLVVEDRQRRPCFDRQSPVPRCTKSPMRNQPPKRHPNDSCQLKRLMVLINDMIWMKMALYIYMVLVWNQNK